MLRRDIRLRRDYLYRKSLEGKKKEEYEALIAEKTKEFPLVKGGCGRSGESVEFSTGALGGCVVAAAALVLVMMF